MPKTSVYGKLGEAEFRIPVVNGEGTSTARDRFASMGIPENVMEDCEFLVGRIGRVLLTFLRGRGNGTVSGVDGPGPGRRRLPLEKGEGLVVTQFPWVRAKGWPLLSCERVLTSCEVLLFWNQRPVRMHALRDLKILFSSLAGSLLLLIGFANVTEYPTNPAFMRLVAIMEALFSGEALSCASSSTHGCIIFSISPASHGNCSVSPSPSSAPCSFSRSIVASWPFTCASGRGGIRSLLIKGWTAVRPWQRGCHHRRPALQEPVMHP
jgi:hypothetical protein